jgi:hypothetical protein
VKLGILPEGKDTGKVGRGQNAKKNIWTSKRNVTGTWRKSRNDGVIVAIYLKISAGYETKKIVTERYIAHEGDRKSAKICV